MIFNWHWRWLPVSEGGVARCYSVWTLWPSCVFSGTCLPHWYSSHWEQSTNTSCYNYSSSHCCLLFFELVRQTGTWNITHKLFNSAPASDEVPAKHLLLLTMITTHIIIWTHSNPTNANTLKKKTGWQYITLMFCFLLTNREWSCFDKPLNATGSAPLEIRVSISFIT